jgi:ketosteroid isomerase-like protein
MKHLLCILSLAMMASCTKPETQESKAIEHIYKPVYTDNFKISDPKNVLLIDQMHKTLIAKDFKGAFEMLDDSVVFQLGTGQTLKGKPAVMDYMEKGFSQVNIKNYQVEVSFPVVGENGDDWVLVWDTADIETPDGKSVKGRWMEGFRIKNGKINMVNQYEKFHVK